MEYHNLKFGTIITIKNKLVRKTRRSNGKTFKIWEDQSLTRKFEESEGILIGYRTVSNGTRRIWSDHTEYNATDYFKVALVVRDPNENPFYSNQIEPVLSRKRSRHTEPKNSGTWEEIRVRIHNSEVRRLIAKNAGR